MCDHLDNPVYLLRKVMLQSCISCSLVATVESEIDPKGCRTLDLTLSLEDVVLESVGK